MLRFAAAALLALAAFGVSVPWLDRFGTAALGIALAALAVPARPRLRRIPKPALYDRRLVPVEEKAEAINHELRERLAEYGEQAS